MHQSSQSSQPITSLVLLIGVVYIVFTALQTKHLEPYTYDKTSQTPDKPTQKPPTASKRRRGQYSGFRLPLELCEYIIDFLWDDLDALEACALTCREFATRCDYSMDGISRANCLTNEAGLNSLFKDLLASKEYSRYFDILKIRVEEHSSWVSAAPLRLASKLPRLQQLELIGVFDSKKSHFNSIQHFGSFRSITTLRLAECIFPKFADFARFVISLHNLSTLDILDVDWDEYLIQQNILGPKRTKKLHLKDFYIDVSFGRRGYLAQLLNWFGTTPVNKTITTLSVEIRFAGDFDCLTKFLQSCGDALHQLKIHTHPGIMQEASLSGEFTGMSTLTLV